jgi:hypothetical protein
VTYLGQSVWSWLALAVGSVAVGLALAVGGLLPSPESGCELISEEPSGPEPEVTVWHRVWDCSGETVVEEYLAEGWECGAVWEEGRWLEAGCSTVEELEERLESIRHSRSGLRDWEEGQ